MMMVFSGSATPFEEFPKDVVAKSSVCCRCAVVTVPGGVVTEVVEVVDGDGCVISWGGVVSLHTVE